jgi:phospholipid/cholesterol/gamma-HCH transport system substrate-binding protein
VTRTLATNTEQINTILHNTAEASGHLLPVLQSSQEMMRNLSMQIIPAASQALHNLDVMTANLSVVSREIKENPAVIIRGKTEQPLGPGEK